MRKLSLVLLSLALAGAANATTADDNHIGDYLSAQMAASRHDMVGAAALYREALAADPNNADLLNRTLFYTVGAGDLDEAMTLAKRAIKTTPADRLARTVLIVGAFKDADYREARMQIAQSSKGPAGELLLTLLDAWASEGTGDIKQVQADIKVVTDQGGAEALAAYNRALILDLAGQDADADTAYKQALAVAGHASRLVESYGRFLERTGRADDAHTFYGTMDSDPAVAPIAARGLKRIADGRKPDRLVNSPAAGAAEVLFGFAASLNEQSNADLAIIYLRTALYLMPQHDLARIVLADRLESIEKIDDAINIYRGVDKDSLYGDVAQVQAAIDESRLDHNSDAIADLKRFTADHPANIDGWNALGDVYRSDEKFPEAVGAYDRAVKLRTPPGPKDWSLFYARGVSEERAKNWTAAENDLLEALKLSPDQASVLNYLGYSWVDQDRRLPEAIAMLEKARALSPFDGYIVDSVGWAYYRLGRYQDASKTLLEAVQLVPGDPTINEHLGDAYWRAGRKVDARFQWNHALAFGPTDDQKAKLEEKLKDGLGGGRS